MASEVPDEQSGGTGRPVLLAAAFAAGSVATLATKALLRSRRTRKLDAEASDEDLPTVLRRATLDLAIAATNQAAESLSRDESATKDEAPAAERSN